MTKCFVQYSILLVSAFLLFGYTDYNSILEKVGEDDQSVRQWVMNISSLSPEDITQYSFKMAETDSLNRITVANILDKAGWPDGLSDKANKAIWLVIIHSDIDFQEKYLLYIERKANEGIVDRTEFATLYDKMMKNKGLPQRYGTQINMDVKLVDDVEESMTFSLWPVEDMVHLDSIRASVGLQPIDEYLVSVEKSIHGEEDVF